MKLDANFEKSNKFAIYKNTKNILLQIKKYI